MEKLSKKTISARLRYGWSYEDAYNKPLYKRPVLPEGMRQCSRCKSILPESSFIKRTDRPNQWQPHCRLCDSDRNTESRKLLREKLIQHYSGGTMSCAHCLESRLDVLDLDHIEGGGVQDRRGHKTNQAYYKSLLDRGFPHGLRVLCRNCNWMAWIERKERMKHERRKGKRPGI